MRRAVWIALAALLVFAVFLVARLPVRWVSGWIPSNVQCARLAGSVWEGQCAALVVQGQPIGDLRWSLAPARLFAGRIAGDVILTKGPLDVRGYVEATPAGSGSARNIRAVLPLDPAVLPQAPRNLRGLVRADLATLAWNGRTITGIAGRIEAFELAQRAVALGDYVVVFPAASDGNELVGTLDDLRGPLDVSGTLRLTGEPGWEIQGMVAARPEASPELMRQLQYLGRPDPAGRRPFSMAGTW
jgi:Type II secretion system (T2SS), protein N